MATDSYIVIVLAQAVMKLHRAAITTRKTIPVKIKVPLLVWIIFGRGNGCEHQDRTIRVADIDDRAFVLKPAPGAGWCLRITGEAD